jgi:ketosteroid isomerase-like protein
MRARAATPEELETLLEDAFVVRDRVALAELFEPGAVLVDTAHPREARGRAAIARAAAAGWARRRTYVAHPERVVQKGDTALVVAEGGLSVARRGADGAWRYAISLLSLVPDEDGGPGDGPCRQSAGSELHPPAPAEKGQKR